MMHPVYEEMIELIASGATPQEIIDFRPSRQAQLRARELLTKNRDETITQEEQDELSQFLMLEHVLRMAKARARQKLMP